MVKHRGSIIKGGRITALTVHVHEDRKERPDYCSYTKKLRVDRSLVFHIHECVATRLPVQLIHCDNSALLLLESARIPADLEYLIAQPTEQQLLTISFELSTSFLPGRDSLTTRALRSASSQTTPHYFLPSQLRLKMTTNFMTLRYVIA